MSESEADIKNFNSNPWNSSSSAGASQDVVDDIREPIHREKPKFDPKNLLYDMSGEKFMIIFNHYEYKKTKYFGYETPSPRKGTDADVRALKDNFGSLGFKVLTYRDLTHDDILGYIGRISNQDHSRTSCLIVVILTHGKAGGELYAADRPYPLKDITLLLENGHPTLVNKPKLFFIQACRGDQVDAGRTVQYDGDEDSNTITVPSHADFLFLYSTVEDFLSWRDSGGSWLIQELCEVMKEHYDSADLLHLVTLTIRNVAYGRASNTKNKAIHNKKQTPECRYSLTKLVRFDL